MVDHVDIHLTLKTSVVEANLGKPRIYLQNLLCMGSQYDFSSTMRSDKRFTLS